MHILLLEDDIDLGQAVAEHLESVGHTVDWMKLCSQATEAMHNPEIELILMDLRLPDGDGVSLLRTWRAAQEKRAVIVLTARDQISDRVAVLQAGADDYMVKPFDLDELAARVEAVGRRTGIKGLSEPAMGGTLSLDLINKVARRDGQIIDLTAMEWALLACLAARPGHTLSRDQIKADLARAGRSEADSNSMEVIISRLRRKIGPHLITTHRGLGYRFEKV
jgi:two-component system, OmpR family, response regulator